MHTIAGKAVAFGEALRPAFKEYAANMIANAKTLCSSLKENGFSIVSGDTDCHMMIVDLSATGVNGKEAEAMLDEAGITCNKNTIPFDKLPPTKTSGIRLGTAAMTTRGFGISEFKEVGSIIADVIKNRNIKHARTQTLSICNDFPLYQL